MPCKQLSDEYTLHIDTFKTQTFEGVLSGKDADLKKILEGSGPDRNYYTQLTFFRDVSLKLKEADRIMEAAGVPSTGTPTEASVKKAASLKFIRHLYLVGTRGSQEVWVLSTPKAYTKFTYDELMDVKTNSAQIKTKLTDVDEQFSEETKKRLGEATQMGLAWCEAAKLVLSTASSNAQSMEKVKRWFAANDTSTANLNTTIASLQDGFKKLSTALNRNMIIITDMPPYRSDASKNLVEAFVRLVGGNPERPRTIYIEKALFENYNVSVLHDMKKNWARVIVHEASHSEVKTDDKGYAWKGIAPGTKITAANAAINADSWAFFAADCGGALTPGDIQRALNGTGGNLNKLDKNWN